MNEEALKTADELGVTEEQRQNLAKLSVGMRDLRPNGYKGSLEMGGYCQIYDLEEPDDDPDEEPEPHESAAALHNCGTTACLVGHAPYLGIGLEHVDALVNESDQWSKYCRRTFGTKSGELWVWMFGPCWEDSALDAIKRVAYTLQTGHPCKADAADLPMLCGEAPDYPDDYAEFEPDWPAIEALAAS